MMIPRLLKDYMTASYEAMRDLKAQKRHAEKRKELMNGS